MNAKMEKLKNHLIENGFEYEETYDNSTMYFSKIYGEYEWYIALTNPHSGNDYKWLLRAEREDEFDRWSVATFQEFYDDVPSFMATAVIQLNKFFESYESYLESDLNS